MVIKIIDRGAIYEFQKGDRIHIKDGKLVIEYTDDKGEHHVEIGYIPDELEVKGEK